MSEEVDPIDFVIETGMISMYREEKGTRIEFFMALEEGEDPQEFPDFVGVYESDDELIRAMGQLRVGTPFDEITGR